MIITKLNLSAEADVYQKKKKKETKVCIRIKNREE